MMDKQLINKIEMYLDGELNHQESHSFQKSLLEDPELAKEFKLRNEVNQAILDEDIADLRRLLDRIHKKHTSEKHNPVYRIYSKHKALFSGIAATLLALIIFGGILIFSEKKISNENLFNNYYSSDDAVIISRSSANSGNELVIKDALLAYQEKNYQKTIQLLSDFNQNSLANYYLGLAYLETGETENAIGIFKQLIENNDNLFVEQSEWYLGLCYLKTNQMDKAKDVFENIANSENIFKTKALEVLRNM
jgi:tetratricopeptide (TPR) repeat protein